MGLRLNFPSSIVSTSWKTDFGFACPIERVVHKSERPVVDLLQVFVFPKHKQIDGFHLIRWYFINGFRKFQLQVIILNQILI